MCTDQSLTFLNGLGYNVVRHPREGLDPLDLLGKDKQGLRRLGTLSELWIGEGAKLPEVRKDLSATGISGQRSSKFDISLGVSLLERLIRGMGGEEAKLDASYGSASTLEFVYENVRAADVSPIGIGDYLANGKLARKNPILERYLFGEADDMFVVTNTIRSKSFGVVAYDKKGAQVKVSVPEIQNVVKGNISVSGASESTTKLTYAGEKELVFGFQCFHIYLHDGKLALGGAEVSGGMALSMMRPMDLGTKGQKSKKGAKGKGAPKMAPLVLQKARLIRLNLEKPALSELPES